MLEIKKNVAKEALNYVKSGMVLGLGSGSTAEEFVKQLGEKIKLNKLKNVVGVATSLATEKLALSCGVPLSDLDKFEMLDLAVDGADEVDPSLNLIKGLGKALLREKMVEVRAKKFIVIVDDSKLVLKLGKKSPLPVEIVKFSFESTLMFLNNLPDCRAELWVEENGKIAETDNGNYLVKCFFNNGIDDVYDVAFTLDSAVGVVEHGLFLDMVSLVIVGGSKGVQLLGDL